MSSNMRALIEMKRRDQAQEEERYLENRLEQASIHQYDNAARGRAEEIAKVEHRGNLESARRAVTSVFQGGTYTASHADGGVVKNIQAKGFVPVKVSNGEFEFTPEQVANIGAAMLASKG